MYGVVCKGPEWCIEMYIVSAWRNCNSVALLLPLLLPTQLGDFQTLKERISYICCNRDTKRSPSQTIFFLKVWHFAAVLSWTACLPNGDCGHGSQFKVLVLYLIIVIMGHRIPPDVIPCQNQPPLLISFIFFVVWTCSTIVNIQSSLWCYIWRHGIIFSVQWPSFRCFQWVCFLHQC